MTAQYEGARAERLWPEQVVELLGLASTDSLRATAGRSRRLAALGKLTKHDLPLPDGRDRRQVPTTTETSRLGHKVASHRTVTQSWWYRGTIEDYLPNRRGRGNPNRKSRAA